MPSCVGRNDGEIQCCGVARRYFLEVETITHISEDSSPNPLLRNTRAIVFKSCIVAIANFDTRHKKMPADTERLLPSTMAAINRCDKEPPQYLVDNLICA